MGTPSGQRSRKDLACTPAASAYQKQFGADLRRRVVDEGEPFAIVQADTPHEIFHVMGIPIITNQWWSAYISAKQLSNHYFEVMAQAGYPKNSCKYCSLGLACTLANDPKTAPWGGLPKPTVLVARMTCDCIQHVFGQWADPLGSEFFPMEALAREHKDPRWFAHSKDQLEQVYDPERIALAVSEMRDLIALLENRTGRKFDEAKLHYLMEPINEQEGYIWEAAQVIGDAQPSPVSIAEQIPNTMIPQWHLGSDWAVNHGKRFRDEVMERIASGAGSAANEKIRLMWIGAGVWHEPVFYQALEGRMGAVFVWSMYMPFTSPQYIREVQGRPMEALASRVCSMNEVLHLPPWMNGWMTSEAERCGIDACVVLLPLENRLSQSRTKITAEALEKAGVSVLMIDADMVDAGN
ncbi:2-hydroxyacyl-CoA dehydratase [Novosphingobium sp. ERN07]|nr:2-hydroxyacyl-CoA dehydratase family protein [Novosphingobium sp. ERN07]NLR70528.1 2-hydroxyacyl-CoA dehydratase [Novosphingobium sp. ERN07]